MQTLLAILTAILPGFFTSDARPIYKAIVIALILGALVAWLLLAPTGCMTTTDLDGKVYSFRLDILTPIGATTGPQSGTTAAPAAPRRAPAAATTTTQPHN
jgi:hypothetical protein